MEEVAQENPQHELVAENPNIGDSVPGATTSLWNRLRGAQERLSSAAQEAILVGVELLVVVLWALLITRPYQNMNPAVVPAGREYLSAIQTNHLWTNVAACGWCAVWNGSVAGGAPALSDPYGSMLHPLVILTTLGWGVPNGAKLALIGAFIMGGLAQWWLAHVLGIGRVARVWSACLAVAAGHLGGRIAQGTFGLVLSTAACALVLPPLLLVFRDGGRRAAVLLGVMLGLALLAGQGYMQAGLLFLLPSTLLLVPRERFRLVLLRFALAAVIAVLLAGPFLVPFLHFLPQFAKDADPAFGSGQPFAAVPLNLVIDDPTFYANESLHKLLFPYLYINFVSWFAVLLALWGLRASADRERRRTVACLALIAVLALWISSGVPFALLANLTPFPALGDRLASIRYYPVIAGLAVPPILGLAAIGLDRLWKAPWMRLRVAVAADQPPASAMLVNVRWLLLIPMILALRDARVFTANWVAAVEVPPPVEVVLASLRTPDLQWVNPPFGEHVYIEPAIRMGLKLSYGFRTWRWNERPSPDPVLALEVDRVPPDMAERTRVADIPLYAARPGREYAAVTIADGRRAICQAYGIGGELAMRCEAPDAGVLVVRENSWSGWRAWVDGRPATLLPGQWLSVAIARGLHTIEFRYLPWDVPLGLLLAVVGVALAIFCWFKADLRRPAPPIPS
jgi:hypothetical protein